MARVDALSELIGASTSVTERISVHISHEIIRPSERGGDPEAMIRFSGEHVLPDLNG